MRVGFAGTPEFASTALERIVAAGFTVPLVLTQPDRPAGRGLQLQASAVKHAALAHGIPVAQPRSLRLDGKYPDEAQAGQAALQAAQLDVLVVAAYGLLLPQWVLDLPRLGCLNIHASLLPRWRGAAPIHRAIEAGDAHTGVTIMQMDAGLDTGAMCLQALTQAQTTPLPQTPQPLDGITYAHKIAKDEAWLDWSHSAQVLERKIRAFTPFPGGAAQYHGETLKIWQAHAQAQAHNAPPGQVLAADAHGVVVACGSGVLCLTQLQRAGGKRLAAGDFLRGFSLPVGSQLQRP